MSAPAPSIPTVGSATAIASTMAAPSPKSVVVGRPMMVAADGTVTFGLGTFIFSRFVADVGASRLGMPFERLNVTRGFWYHSREPSSRNRARSCMTTLRGQRRIGTNGGVSKAPEMNSFCRFPWITSSAASKLSSTPVCG
eukprot:4490319-Prymnesium_polylepis.2